MTNEETMPPPNDFAWKSLLENISKQIEHLTQNMVTKDEVRREFEIISEKFEIIAEREDDRKAPDAEFRKDYLETKAKASLAYQHANNIANGFKWFLRAIVIACLPFLIGVSVQFFNAWHAAYNTPTTQVNITTPVVRK